MRPLRLSKAEAALFENPVLEQAYQAWAANNHKMCRKRYLMRIRFLDQRACKNSSLH